MDQHRFRNLLATEALNLPASVSPAIGFVACPAFLWTAAPLDVRLWQHHLYQLAYVRALEDQVAAASRAALSFSWN
jgi:hypothetical protein